jgi:hypothetical protein
LKVKIPEKNKSMLQAQKDLAETQKYIKELLDQVSGN